MNDAVGFRVFAEAQQRHGETRDATRRCRIAPGYREWLRIRAVETASWRTRLTPKNATGPGGPTGQSGRRRQGIRASRIKLIDSSRQIGVARVVAPKENVGQLLGGAPQRRRIVGAAHHARLK